MELGSATLAVEAKGRVGLAGEDEVRHRDTSALDKELGHTAVYEEAELVGLPCAKTEGSPCGDSEVVLIVHPIAVAPVIALAVVRCCLRAEVYESALGAVHSDALLL